jgi:hypothetical protein
LSDGRRYEPADLEAAIERLGEGSLLADAEAEVAAVAPSLQRILADALASGGWFDGGHTSQVDQVAAIPDPAERATATATLLAEETRIGMMVGVAVGWALAGELGRPQTTDPADEASRGPAEPDAERRIRPELSSEPEE